MHLSTVFVSCVFVLAGTSTGIVLPVGRENMLMARSFTDSYSTPEVEARAYNMEADSYTHGGAVSENNFKPSRRRSFYEPPRIDLNRRRTDLPPEEDIQMTPPAAPAQPAVAPAPQPAVAQRHHPAVAPAPRPAVAPAPPPAVAQRHYPAVAPQPAVAPAPQPAVARYFPAVAPGLQLTITPHATPTPAPRQ